jgi:hypothetical protein
VVSHLDLAFDYVVDLLSRGEKAQPRQFDPSGEHALREAVRVRRGAMEHGGERVARKEAAQLFGRPTERPSYTTKLPEPLYVPARVASN